MKRITILVLIFIVSAGTAILIKYGIGEYYRPKISFDHKKYDFDTLRNQNDANFYFVYKNTGITELKIYDIKTSCGCTIPSWNDIFLKPNEKDSFKVEYNIENRGYFMKEIMVYSTSKTSPDRLEVMGYVPFE